MILAQGLPQIPKNERLALESVAGIIHGLHLAGEVVQVARAVLGDESGCPEVRGSRGLATYDLDPPHSRIERRVDCRDTVGEGLRGVASGRVG